MADIQFKQITGTVTGDDLLEEDISPLSEFTIAEVCGYDSPGDHGGGLFYLDLHSTDEVPGLIFKPNNVTAGDPGRWVRIITSTVYKSAWFGIKSNGLDQETAIGDALSITGLTDLVFDFDGDVTLDGQVHVADDKRLVFKNGCRLVGTGLLDGGLIDCDYQIQCIGDDLAVANFKNDKLSIKWFGAKGDGVTNDTEVFRKVSSLINSLDGGVVLAIPNGTYIVGKQTLAGSTGLGYAYLQTPIITITDCTKRVVIDGYGSILKLADGLHFGSFDPVTGAVYNPSSLPFYSYDYAAYPGNVINANGNRSVTVRHLTINGNVQNLVIGGQWGDIGRQLPGDGIAGAENDELIVENVTSTNCPRDGVQVGNTVATAATPVKKILLLNSVFDGNVRQGFSWVGGNHLYAQNCRFINTGKAVNTNFGGAVASAPGAGVDMEAELGLIRNGVFEDCVIDNNSGVGLLSVGDVADILYNNGQIIGATSWSIYGTGPRAMFNNVLIVGSPVNLRIGSGPNDRDNAQFNNCLITLDSTLSPSGNVYGNYVMDFGGGAGGFFTNCTIDSYDRGTVYGGGGCVFTNCTFKQGNTATGYNGYPFMSGNFYGVNRFYRPGTGGMLPGLDISNFYGPFYVNDVEITGLEPNNLAKINRSITTGTSSELLIGVDVDITDASKGFVLKSPGGTKYRITVDNVGSLSTVVV